MNFSERFRFLRNRKGITQEKVAHDLDVPESTVRRWETDKGAPKTERLPYIADYFGVSVDYLMGRDDEENRIYLPLDKTEMIIREVVNKYNIDLTRPGAREQLETIIQFVANHPPTEKK